MGEPSEETPEKPASSGMAWQWKFVMAIVISVVAAALIAGITLGAMMMYNINKPSHVTARSKKYRARRAQAKKKYRKSPKTDDNDETKII